ncbi:hypothetical protein BDW74DRAFT_183186 [Aspergillus multicolor]|uniref:uncharacterized protein n=1 Tax=Aspergillus multicolor TaxID=41759 RepID=UPI003CCDDA52
MASSSSSSKKVVSIGANNGKGKDEKDGSRTCVRSQWDDNYPALMTRDFKNPGKLSYRNAVMVMLVHTLLLVFWMAEVTDRHTKASRLKKPSLLSIFQDLVDFYWHGNRSVETDENCMKALWGVLLKTSCSRYAKSTDELDCRTFVRLFFEQLEVNIRAADPKRVAELEDYFKVKRVIYHTCPKCKHAESKEDKQFLLTSQYEDTTTDLPLYEVHEAIDVHLKSGATESVSRTCGKCDTVTKDSKHTTTKLSHLPEVLFIRANHVKNNKDGTQKLNGRLDLKEHLTIPGKMQSDPKAQDIKYELYSMVFTYCKVAPVAPKDEHNVCVVKQPTGTWARVSKGQVSPDLTLDQVLSTFTNTVQLPVLLAYRQLPLSGDPPKNFEMRVFLEQGITINSDSGLVQYNFGKLLELPRDKKLIELGRGKKVQPATFAVTFTSKDTGEVWEGTGIIKLKRREHDDGGDGNGGDRDGGGGKKAKPGNSASKGAGAGSGAGTGAGKGSGAGKANGGGGAGKAADVGQAAAAVSPAVTTPKPGKAPSASGGGESANAGL